MATPLDVQGTIPRNMAMIIGVVVVVGLVLAFTPFRVEGYVLLTIAAALYVFASIRTLVQLLR
jgi:hypothetical protein